METDYSYTFEVEGQTLTATIVPESWMYHYRGLEIEVTLEQGGGRVRLLDKKTLFSNATETDVQILAGRVKLLRCWSPGCGNFTFDPRSVQTPTGGLCQNCFKEHLAKLLAREERVDRSKRLENFKSWQSRGYQYVVMAWIHPIDEDEFPHDFGFETAPTPGKIREELKKVGCTIQTDFKLYPIEKIIEELQKPPH